MGGPASSGSYLKCPPSVDVRRELWDLLRQVPAGCVTTYGDLAEALGDIRAARWVGEFMLRHEHGEGCSCHRVIRRTGELGGYVTGHASIKAGLLQAEGVPVSGGKAPLDRVRFCAFRGEAPLKRLAAWQVNQRGRNELIPRRLPALVAGVDVSYGPADRAVAAYALVDVEGGRLVWSTTCVREAVFPYIPGYLTFREVPVLTALIKQVRGEREVAELVFVDGNGILHPRRAGVATAFGMAASVNTIGIGKKLLCGRVDEEPLDEHGSRAVRDDGEWIGVQCRAGPESKPFYVSPGHGIDVDSAHRAARLLLRGHRLPEPIHLADAISRRAARSVSAGLEAAQQ